MSEGNSFPGWYCVNQECDEVLGHVVVGELEVSDRVDPSSIKSRGTGMIISCPRCGTKKVWYSSSPLVRSLEQLIETLSEQIARRSLNIIHKDLVNEEALFGKKRVDQLSRAILEGILEEIEGEDKDE